MLLQLLDGAYQARSVIAANQRCVNLYPEVNQLSPAAPFPQPITATLITHYPTPGLTQLATVGSGPIRGIYVASTGARYVASGSYLYSVDANWVPLQLGYLGSKTTPVSMIDNGDTLVVVDGSPFGFQVNLATNAFSQIIDPAFYGANRVDFIDTFLVFNRPGTSFFYSTLSNAVTPLDATYIAGKTGFVDNLVAAVMLHNEIWLIGEQTSEVWGNVGGSTFPFARTAGTFIPMGCAAPASIAKATTPQGAHTILWLAKNEQGARQVVQGMPYQAMRVSTHAIEAQFATYATVDDAIGMTYQMQGHTFYVLTFPTADVTWVYDLSTALWHEWRWTDGDGYMHRARPNCMAYVNGVVSCGDWQTGTIYKLDDEAFTDNGMPIVRIRSFMTTQDELKRIRYTNFRADMEAGSAAASQVMAQYLTAAGSLITSDGTTPISTNNNAVTASTGSFLVGLKYSDDAGRTWSGPLYNTLGDQGAFNASLNWNRLGFGRRRVFELQWSAPVFTALNGASIQVEEAVS